MDDLRAQVSGLADLLTRTVARVDSISAAQGRAEERAMESRLAAGSLTGEARQGGVEIPDAIEFGAPIMSRLAADGNLSSYIPGRIDPFEGRANILRDPTLEQLVATTTGIGTTETTLGSHWNATAVFTGAGSPFCDIESAVDDRITGLARGSSSPINVVFGWGATGAPVTLVATVLPADTSGVVGAPWLVAAVRATWNADEFVTDGLTGTVKLQILDGSDVVIAESDPAVPLEAGEGIVQALLSCAYADPSPSEFYRPRVVISVAAPSIVGTPAELVALTDWQFHESDTEDVPSFTPAVGSWVPNALVSFSSSMPMVTGHDSVTGGARFELYPDGSMVWYDENDAEVTRLDPGGHNNGGFMFPLVLDSPVATNNAVTTVEWASFPVKDGRSYAIDLFIWYDVTSTAQGCQTGFRHPGGIAQGIVQTFGQGSPTGTVTERLTQSAADTDAMTTVSATDGTSGRSIRFQVNYQCTADGMFSLRFLRGGSSGAPGVTIRHGSGGMVAVSPVI